MNFNDSCGIDAFRTESFATVVQALNLVSLKSTLGAYQREMSCIRKLDIRYFILGFFLQR